MITLSYDYIIKSNYEQKCIEFNIPKIVVIILEIVVVLVMVTGFDETIDVIGRF